MAIDGTAVTGSKRRRTSARWPAALLVLALAATAACSSGDGSGSDGAGGVGGGSSGEARTLRVVVPEEPPSLDAGSVGSAQGRVSRNILEALVDIDTESGEVLPVLATGWEQVDERSWRFHLREGVSFHNGEAFNADAVVAAVERIYGPGEPLLVAELMPQLEAVAEDELTVVVSAEEAAPILPRQMFFVPIMEPGATGEERDVREPVGTGPYQLDARTPEQITLTAFDGYWGDAPPFDSVSFQWREESSVRAQMLANGEADLVTDLAPQDFGDLTIVEGFGDTPAFRPDPHCPYFSDLRVRQALNQVLDRETLSETVFGGLAEPAAQLVGPGMTGFDEERTPVAYDPATAKEVVDEVRAEAGWPTDLPVKIIYRPDYFLGAEELVQVFAQELEDLGFPVELQPLSVDPWLDAFFVKPDPPDRCGVVELAHGNEFRDASYTVDLFYAEAGSLSLNSDAGFEQDYAEVKQLSDDSRGPAFATLLAYEADHMANVIPVVHAQRAYALADGLSWTPRADALVMAAAVEVG